MNTLYTPFFLFSFLFFHFLFYNAMGQTLLPAQKKSSTDFNGECNFLYYKFKQRGKQFAAIDSIYLQKPTQNDLPDPKIDKVLKLF